MLEMRPASEVVNLMTTQATSSRTVIVLSNVLRPALKAHDMAKTTSGGGGSEPLIGEPDPTPTAEKQIGNPRQAAIIDDHDTRHSDDALATRSTSTHGTAIAHPRHGCPAERWACRNGLVCCASTAFVQGPAGDPELDRMAVRMAKQHQRLAPIECRSEHILTWARPRWNVVPIVIITSEHKHGHPATTAKIKN
jgi:hypothetical protein